MISFVFLFIFYFFDSSEFEKFGIRIATVAKKDKRSEHILCKFFCRLGYTVLISKSATNLCCVLLGSPAMCNWNTIVCIPQTVCLKMRLIFV